MTQAVCPDLGDFLSDRVPADVARILEGFGAASARLRDALATAPLTGMLGASGVTNVQNEATQKLDDRANEIFCDAFALPGVARLISEEMADPLELGDGPYTLAFDPLDGSSNIGVASVGSILGVYEGCESAPSEERPMTGRQLVAAAFVVYGLPTIMMVATTSSADGFAYDPADGCWRQAFPAVMMPEACYTSINWTYRERWAPHVARAVDSASDGLRGRYSGSMVEDILRVTFSGGVFLYPEDSASPNGKLRMLYEICPIGLVMEAAGGAASDGTRSVLDVPMTGAHQRGPFIAGDAGAVERYRQAYASG